MTLTFIKTQKHAFIVDVVEDALRKNLGIVYGRDIHLYAQLVITTNNPRGTMKFTDYYSSTPTQVCNQRDVIEQRELNNDENDIYNRLTNHRKLSKANREYLKKYFFSEIKTTNI